MPTDSRADPGPFVDKFVGISCLSCERTVNNGGSATRVIRPSLRCAEYGGRGDGPVSEVRLFHARGFFRHVDDVGRRRQMFEHHLFHFHTGKRRKVHLAFLGRG